MLSLKRGKQQGAALLCALLVLAICSALAAFMMMAMRVNISHTQLAFGADRLTLMLQGVQDWAIEVVAHNKDLRKVKQLKLSRAGINVSGMVYDVDGRVNVNILREASNSTRLVKVLRAVVPSLSQQHASLIVAQLSQYVSPDPSGYFVRFDKTVSDTSKPQQVFPHQAMVSLSELRQLPALPYSVYAQLRATKPQVLTVLPDSNFKLNVNYASFYSFMALSGVKATQARRLLQCREQAGYFNEVTDFVKRCGVGMALDSQELTTNTQYYLVTGTASQGQQHLEMQALLKLDQVKNKPDVTIVWQEYNGE